MTRKTKYDYYNDAFKVTAVELGALPGVQSKDVAEILDIHPVMLYRWKQEYREGSIMPQNTKATLTKENDRELKRLRAIEKAHEKLKMQHEILKKNIQYCSNQKKKFSSSSIAKEKIILSN